MESNEAGAEHEQGSALERIADAAGTVITGIPTPLRRGLGKAIERLCIAAADWPATYLESLASDRRALVAARQQLAAKVAESIASGVEVPAAASQAAANIWIKKIIGRQANLDAVAMCAIKHSAAEAIHDAPQDAECSESKLIDDDWLNIFEKEAENASSDQLRIAFGRILAGEARRPGTFSPLTIRILAQLPRDTAELFQVFCGMATVLYDGTGVIIDARVWQLKGSLDEGSGSAGDNDLAEYGLSFAVCMHLVEAGLVSPQLESNMNYRLSVTAPSGNFGRVMEYCGEFTGLAARDSEYVSKDLKVHGVSLTRAGRELLKIIDAPENAKYTKDRNDFVSRSGFDWAVIAWVVPWKSYNWVVRPSELLGNNDEEQVEA